MFLGVSPDDRKDVAHRGHLERPGLGRRVMRVVRSTPDPPHTHFLADQSGRVVIEVYHHTRAHVPDYPSMDPLVLHLAFVAPDVRGTRQRLLAAGATSAGEVTTTPTGDELAFLRDPWGVPIQLVRRSRPLVG